MAPNSKAAIACKTMQSMGYSVKVIKPVLKNLLKLYDNNWKFIEDENYRVLIDAIMESQEIKVPSIRREQRNALLADETEESEPPLKRSKSNSQSPSYHDFENNHHQSSAMGLNQTKETQLLSDDVNNEHVSSLNFSGKRLITYDGNNHSHSYQVRSSPVIESVAFSDNDFVPRDPPRFLVEGGSYGSCSKAKANCSQVLELIDPEAKEITGKSSHLEGDHFESNDSNQLNEEEEEHSALNASRIDIASSSQSEVKISLTYKSPLGSYFRAPSLESVLKRVEEKCIKSYGITQPGFSVLKLMKDMCESFLAAFTPSHVISKENASSSKGADHQFTFSISSNVLNGVISYRNRILVELASRIPEGLGPIHMDMIRRMKIFSADGSGCLIKAKKIDRKIREIESLASSTGLYVEDITKGLELYKIPLINEINDEPMPHFYYIQQNVVYKNAYVKFLLARISDENCCSTCFGDCLSSEIPCACAGETGGEFAYAPGGPIKEKYLESYIAMNRDPRQGNLFYCKDCPLERTKGKKLSGRCKGHLVRKFIKECWYKCGCSMACGNRVVQRSITARLQVFMTGEGKGWGVRALEDMPKGAFICEYVGEVVTNNELYERNMHNRGERHTYPVLLDADWGSEGVLKDEEALCLDATSFGNVARFINHRCSDANLVEIPVEVETPDHHYYHLAFFTRRKVNALEELTWDYGIDFDDHKHPVKAFKCHCGSKLCRDQKSNKRRKSRS